MLWLYSHNCNFIYFFPFIFFFLTRFPDSIKWLFTELAYLLWPLYVSLFSWNQNCKSKIFLHQLKRLFVFLLKYSTIKKPIRDLFQFIRLQHVNYSRPLNMRLTPTTFVYRKLLIISYISWNNLVVTKFLINFQETFVI